MNSWKRLSIVKLKSNDNSNKKFNCLKFQVSVSLKVDEPTVDVDLTTKTVPFLIFSQGVYHSAGTPTWLISSITLFSCDCLQLLCLVIDIGNVQARKIFSRNCLLLTCRLHGKLYLENKDVHVQTSRSLNIINQVNFTNPAIIYFLTVRMLSTKLIVCFKDTFFYIIVSHMVSLNTMLILVVSLKTCWPSICFNNVLSVSEKML